MYHARMPDALEQREVRDRIRVEVAPAEVDAVLGREPLGPVHLARAVADGPDGLAREAAVAHDELRDQQVLDAEIGARAAPPGSAWRS